MKSELLPSRLWIWGLTLPEECLGHEHKEAAAGCVTLELCSRAGQLMPSMSESPAAAALTRAGDINKSSGSPKGKALFGNRSSDAGDDGANTAGKATPSGEM